jgi:ribosomally synthesized peptide (two-chain TOMM family)
MSMDKLMEFRTTFLRSIAEAWADTGFTDQLKTDARKALADRFGYRWPWNGVCDLQIVDSGNRFKWIDDQDGWVYSPDLKDALTLYVPLAPRLYVPGQAVTSALGAASPGAAISPEHQAMALGDYYRQYASLFSDSWGQPPGSQPEASVPGLMTPVIGPTSDYPAGGFMPTDAEFAAFRVALLGAMAKAWQEASGNQEASFTSMLAIDAVAALNTIRGYKLPWTMRIRLVDDTVARWVPPGNPPADHPSHWTQGHPSLLQLYLPDTPKDVGSQPLALATYNATGAEFPFTCTC